MLVESYEDIANALADRGVEVSVRTLKRFRSGEGGRPRVPAGADLHTWEETIRRWYRNPIEKLPPEIFDGLVQLKAQGKSYMKLSSWLALKGHTIGPSTLYDYRESLE